jgi:hypothetical protein
MSVAGRPSLAGRSQQLSAEEVRGLFAEVTFLLELDRSTDAEQCR